MIRPAEILSFWFGELAPDRPVPAERRTLWFGGGAETDDLIRETFLSDLQQAVAGDYDAWQSAPRSALALIILLDQFSRNIFRNTPNAFVNDERALAICRSGIASRQDIPLNVVERAFFYLPLEHSEDIVLQEQSVAAFASLVEAAPPAWQALCVSFHDYAVRHYDIIARFGRFPHRNRILGRASTDEEIAFLRQPGSSF